MNAEQRAVFQGIVYYYRENQVLCRYQATLKEAVAPALLQQALDAARPLAEYYFCHVVWEKREARLEPNTAPCRVRQGSTQPKIPEETNDYLFSLGYEGNTVYLDWFHFLADGRGSAPFFTLLLKLYCNLRSNAGFVCEALASDPPYDVEQLLACYPESQVANDMQKDVLQIHEGTPHFQRLRLDRQSLVDLAQKEGVKPFSALMGLTCQAAQRYLEKNDLVYSYAADTRAALGVPHALYNCIASFQLLLRLEPQARLHSFAKRLDHEIRESLTPERRLLSGVPAEGCAQDQKACVPDGRVHQRLPGRFLGQLHRQPAAAAQPGAGSVPDRFPDLGAAGRCVPCNGGHQPARRADLLH